ncbi:NACHT, LRR and PYD domains-containing protein 12-like isoform X2 [Oncorhynchus nerka]|uniref:NACHT, LRR and PYD domains-containing protein 12-like isoform X2 n=1 Tax=Oncorhynchus nerka TaxID=8023 RepID=UPI001131D41C|nr:NACHT, LRR and PYD domains-containing protein 12-like isoform X2 [Oncorhynchus nerka]
MSLPEPSIQTDARSPLCQERPGSPVPGCVSMKSDGSMGHPINVREAALSTAQRVCQERPDSPVPSCVSIKSDGSMGQPINFREDVLSTEQSCVSMKSDGSMGQPINFREDVLSTEQRVQQEKPYSPMSSCVSMKSDGSMGQPINFREDVLSTEQRVQQEKPYSPMPSCVSMKSDGSMGQPINFREGDRDQQEISKSETLNDQSTQSQLTDLSSIFKLLEQHIISFVKSELKRWKRILTPDYPESFDSQEEDQEVVDAEHQESSARSETLNITLHILRNMNQKELADTLEKYERHDRCQHKLKSNLRKKCERVFEGIAKQGKPTILNKIYTELYITEGGSGEVNKEHEVRLIETASRRPVEQEMPIKCNDIFKPLPGQDKPIRTVLTKGVAGIGKTISVQKFILDWAEGKANQDTHFIFPLTFRELNLMKVEKHSLMDLLNNFFMETKESGMSISDKYNALFVLDGLDECRLPLDFQNNESCFDVTESTSVDVLLTNLIKGNLLPSALLWITSRPAAANQIPPEYVDQVTEVRGFNDPQKEEYFRKRISDVTLANKIITHLKSSRSLYIMCHIPVFCWISATVLQRLLAGAESGEIPKTLSKMYMHFIMFQIKQKNLKYHGDNVIDPHWDKEIILSLGKLAYEQLETGNLIFYEEDLTECGIDVREASVYSGVCTEVFREEFGLHQGKVYCFVHLSIQECLAAFYRFLSFNDDFNTTKHNQQSIPKNLKRRVKIMPAIHFYQDAVDKALQSENGHLDLFLRFLLGLSLLSNQTIFRGLLKWTGGRSKIDTETVEVNKKTIDYIKEKIRENASSEKCINLFHCLNEMNDPTLVQEIQSYLSSGNVSGAKLSPAHWSALAFVLLTSAEELDVFDLKQFSGSDEALLRLLPVVKASKTALLNKCSLSVMSCGALASALCSSSSSLIKLDLSDNDLQDSGVELLSTGLDNPLCKLETLSLSACGVTEEGCASLASALRSNPSQLRELDLSYNNPGDSGVKLLSTVLKNPSCKLETLSLSACGVTEEGCASLASALRSNPSQLRELDLSYNNPGDSGVKLLYAVLEDPHCKLEILRLSNCDFTNKDCASPTLTLKSNPSHLRELDLSYNNPGDSGIKLLSTVLEDSHCKLKTLRLSNCRITEKSCTSLASALRSNPSHLRELDLSGNNPGDSGVKLLSTVLENPHCKVQTLRLSCCRISEDSCASLASALRSNPSHLRELDLTDNEPGDSGVMLLSAVLEDPRCKLETLSLSWCVVKEGGFGFLALALMSNPSHLRELDLSKNTLGDSAVMKLSAVLKDPHCKLERLRLSHCSVTQEGCTFLASALRSNPSHLRELDLDWNSEVKLGVKELSVVLDDPLCRLETLRLVACSVTEESFCSLASALRSNPSHLRELDLRYNYEMASSGVRQLSAVLEDPLCKLEILRLCLHHSDYQGEGFSNLASALRSNPSHLRELNVAGYSQDSRLKLFSAALKDPRCKLEKLICSVPEQDFASLGSALRSNPSHLRELDLKFSEDSNLKPLFSVVNNPLFKLEKLRLSGCDVEEKGCALFSALRSIPVSHLRELDLSNNKPGDSGVMQLSALLNDPRCKLATLKLSHCGLTEEGSTSLASALRSNPSYLRELDLSQNTPIDSGVKLLSAVLEDPRCKLEKLSLFNCRIKEEGCVALASALRSNPSHLRELVLSFNNLGVSGVKLLSAVLKHPLCQLEILKLLDCAITEEGFASLASAVKSTPSRMWLLELNGNDPGDSGVKLFSAVLKDPQCRLPKLIVTGLEVRPRSLSSDQMNLLEST